MISKDITNENRVSPSATAIVALGVAAAWIAAGSTGFLAHSLRSLLTCFVLGVAVLVGWPTPTRQWRVWAIFAGGIVAAILLAVFPLETVNLLAAVVVLSLLAHLRDGLDARAILCAALAILGFAFCHFLYADCPQFWGLADSLGRFMGWTAGIIAGRQLSVGATFGGVDFLVLMLFLYGFWIYRTASPRIHQAIYGILAIVASQLAYLVILAYSEKWTTSLAPIYPIEDDYMHMGASVWQNFVLGMIPWNLPALALVFQTIVVLLMFRMAAWRVEGLENRVAASTMATSNHPISPKAAAWQFAVRFGPIALAILLSVVAMNWPIKLDLKGKTILVYQSGKVDWTKPEYDQVQTNGFGLLRQLTAALGGKFEFSQQLSDGELAKADLVLLLNPDDKFSNDMRSRLVDYVRKGGSLLVAADKNSAAESQKQLEELLAPFGIRLTQETAIGLVDNWEQSSRIENHPIAIGRSDARNAFGIDRCLAIRLHGGAYPILVGRWGWNALDDSAAKKSYRVGDRLGDLVLAAESNSGSGKIVVLGDMQCLSNDIIPISHEFIGQLFGYLSQKTPAVSLWRTIAMSFSVILLLVFICGMQKASQPAITSFVFFLAIFFCRTITLDSRQIALGEDSDSVTKLAYIDASHLEAYSDKLWHPRPTVKEFRGEAWKDTGIVGLARALVRENYLPIRLNSITAERLKRGRLLISIAPGRHYDFEECRVLHDFVVNGGTFLAIVGAQESRASNRFLNEFGLDVPPTPVFLGETSKEPEPTPRKNGTSAGFFKDADGADHSVDFYANWEIKAQNNLPKNEFHVLVAPVVKDRARPTVAYRQVGRGHIVVVADTYFACNENLENWPSVSANNQTFLSWLLLTIGEWTGSNGGDSPASDPSPSFPDDEPMDESGPDAG